MDFDELQERERQVRDAPEPDPIAEAKRKAEELFKKLVPA
jgi:hypothetical protein